MVFKLAPILGEMTEEGVLVLFQPKQSAYLEVEIENLSSGEKVRLSLGNSLSICEPSSFLLALPVQGMYVIRWFSDSEMCYSHEFFFSREIQQIFFVSDHGEKPTWVWQSIRQVSRGASLCGNSSMLLHCGNQVYVRDMISEGERNGRRGSASESLKLVHELYLKAHNARGQCNSCMSNIMIGDFQDLYRMGYSEMTSRISSALANIFRSYQSRLLSDDFRDVAGIVSDRQSWVKRLSRENYLIAVSRVQDRLSTAQIKDAIEYIPEEAEKIVLVMPGCPFYKRMDAAHTNRMCEIFSALFSWMHNRIERHAVVVGSCTAYNFIGKVDHILSERSIQVCVASPAALRARRYNRKVNSSVKLSLFVPRRVKKGLLTFSRKEIDKKACYAHLDLGPFILSLIREHTHKGQTT